MNPNKSSRWNFRRVIGITLWKLYWLVFFVFQWLWTFSCIYLHFYQVTFRKLFDGCLNNINWTLIKVQGETLLYSTNVTLTWNFVPAWIMLTLDSFCLSKSHILRTGMKLHTGMSFLWLTYNRTRSSSFQLS